MLLVAEIAMFVAGIVTLVRGLFNLTAKTIVRGARAYVIGVLMVLTLPLILFLNFAALMLFSAGQIVPGRELWFALIDLGVLVVVWTAIVIIGVTQPKQIDPWDIPIEDDDGDRSWRRRGDDDDRPIPRRADRENRVPPPLPPEERERVRRKDDRTRP